MFICTVQPVTIGPTLRGLRARLTKRKRKRESEYRNFEQFLPIVTKAPSRIKKNSDPYL